MSSAQLEIRLPDNTLVFNSGIHNSLKLYTTLTFPRSALVLQNSSRYKMYIYKVDWIKAEMHFTSGSQFFVVDGAIVTVFTNGADEITSYPNTINLEIFTQ